LREVAIDAPAPAADARSTARRLLALAWPVVVTRSTQVVVGLCDALMVAHLGGAALAATTTGALNTYALLMFPWGIILMVQSFASQLHGAGDGAGARRYGWYGLGVAAATQVIAVAALPLVRPTIGALYDDPAVRDAMGSYLLWRVPSIGAAMGLEALGSYYGGLGNTRLPMRANVAAMALNVCGNWLLIDGHLGAPALGVAGAALASSVSTAFAFAGLLAVFLRGGLRDERRLVPRLHLAEQLRLLRFGVPSGLNWFLEHFAFTWFVNVVVAGLGTTSLAALMTVLQINAVAFMPAFALASAGGILIGQAIGARRKDGVPGIVLVTFGVCGVWECLAGLAYLALPALLFAPFAGGASSAALLAAGARMLRLSAAWQVFDAAAMTVTEALRAAGDTAFTMWARIALAWLVFVPGTWISVRHLGGGDRTAVGWIIGYLALLALVLVLRFRSGAWRRIELVEGAPRP
jgi:MATE family multidrug resistance protein